MKKKTNQLILTTIAIALLVFAFAGTAYALTVPIGDPSFMQREEFDSNPTTGQYSGIGTPVGTENLARDGDPENTNINFQYGVSTGGYVEMANFKKPSDYGYTDFAITWIDIKVSYKASMLATSLDQYRIVAYVDPSATPVVLQDWVIGAAAKYDPGTGVVGFRPWSNVAKPIDLPVGWTWANLAGLRVRVETIRGASGLHTGKFYLYEVWVTAYSTPYPASSTVSVQTPIVSTLALDSFFYVDIYATGMTQLWGYEIVLNFDPAVLTAFEYFSYGPFVSALPSEIGADYVAVAYKTYDGDPTGFTGSTPVCRIYFAVIAAGDSALTLSKANTANIYGGVIPNTPVNGWYGAPPAPEFPLGLSALLLLAPIIPIVFIWRTRPKRRVTIHNENH